MTTTPAAKVDDEVAYPYSDYVRPDIRVMIPADGQVIGSIGCGVGALEATLVAAGREVHGVDISPYAVTIAKTRLSTARVIEPEEKHPFRPESLDGLILADVIEHIPQAWTFLREYVKAVRPGGWVVISVPNMRSRSVFWEFIIKGDWPERESGIFDQTHVQMMSKKRLDRWCAMAGLTIVRRFCLYSPLGPRRNLAVKMIDWCTLGLLHSWLLYGIQVVARRPGGKV